MKQQINSEFVSQKGHKWTVKTVTAPNIILNPTKEESDSIVQTVTLGFVGYPIQGYAIYIMILNQ